MPTYTAASLESWGKRFHELEMACKCSESLPSRVSRRNCITVCSVHGANEHTFQNLELAAQHLTDLQDLRSQESALGWDCPGIRISENSIRAEFFNGKRTFPCGNDDCNGCAAANTVKKCKNLDCGVICRGIATQKCGVLFYRLFCAFCSKQPG